jgi:GAF domain-containing protein
MAVAYEPSQPSRRRRPDDPSLTVVRDPRAGVDALRRLASEVSGQLDLQTLFAEVVADAVPLFGLTRMGLWLYHADRAHPFTIVAESGLSRELLDWVASLGADAGAAGVRAVRSATVVTIRDALVDSVTPDSREV